MNEFESKILVECIDSIIDYRGKTPKKSETGIPTLSAKSVKLGYV
jgi:type I restriction enzyme S subunit